MSATGRGEIAGASVDNVSLWTCRTNKTPMISMVAGAIHDNTLRNVHETFIDCATTPLALAVARGASSAATLKQIQSAASRTSGGAPQTQLHPEAESQQRQDLLALLNQTPGASVGVWLSQIIGGLNSGQYSYIPDPNSVNYIDAVAHLAGMRQIDILDAASRSFEQRGSLIRYLHDFKIRNHDTTKIEPPDTSRNFQYAINEVGSTEPGYIEYQLAVRPIAWPINPTELRAEFDGSLYDELHFTVEPKADIELGLSRILSADGLRNNVLAVSLLWPPITAKSIFLINLFTQTHVAITKIYFW